MMEYKTNDYILLDLEMVKLNNEKDKLNMKTPTCEFAKIIELCYDEDYIFNYPYFVKLNNGKVFFIKENEIIRLLTINEIKNLK